MSALAALHRREPAKGGSTHTLNGRQKDNGCQPGFANPPPRWLAALQQGDGSYAQLARVEGEAFTAVSSDILLRLTDTWPK